LKKALFGSLDAVKLGNYSLNGPMGKRTAIGSFSILTGNFVTINIPFIYSDLYVYDAAVDQMLVVLHGKIEKWSTWYSYQAGFEAFKNHAASIKWLEVESVSFDGTLYWKAWEL
jgi:hypothetical protein